MTSRTILGLAMAAGLGLAPGCGPAPEAGSPGPEPTPVEQVGQLLRTYHELGRPTPKSLKEAEKTPGATPKAVAALRAGDVVIYWGADLDEYGGASAIGYEKKVPEEGGMVILGDGTVVRMTAEEFREVPKPPESKLKPAGAGKASR